MIYFKTRFCEFSPKMMRKSMFVAVTICLTSSLEIGSSFSIMVPSLTNRRKLGWHLISRRFEVFELCGFLSVCEVINNRVGESTRWGISDFDHIKSFCFCFKNLRDTKGKASYCCAVFNFDATRIIFGVCMSGSGVVCDGSFFPHFSG